MKYLFIILLSILFATQICLAKKDKDLYPATNPYPTDEMTDVSVEDILFWVNPNEKKPKFIIVNLNNNIVNLSGNESSYAPILEDNTRYEWSVDLMYKHEPVIGNVWSFTTVPEPATIFLLGIGCLIFVRRK